MRSLPLLLAGRVLPVVALAAAGWAWTSGPYAPVEEQPPAAEPKAEARAEVVHGKPPAPCGVLARDAVAALVPGADAAGKELRLTDPERRRTCSWSALKGYDYRWLDVGYDVRESAAAARGAFASRTEGSGDALPGLGDRALVSVTLTEKDEQQTRGARVVVQSRNALVTVTYNGSDFDSKRAPQADEMREGAVRAARAAVSALTESGARKG